MPVWGSASRAVERGTSWGVGASLSTLSSCNSICGVSGSWDPGSVSSELGRTKEPWGRGLLGGDMSGCQGGDDGPNDSQLSM